MRKTQHFWVTVDIDVAVECDAEADDSEHGLAAVAKARKLLEQVQGGPEDPRAVAVEPCPGWSREDHPAEVLELWRREWARWDAELVDDYPCCAADLNEAHYVAELPGGSRTYLCEECFATSPSSDARVLVRKAKTPAAAVQWAD